jgi:hypothetical protein
VRILWVARNLKVWGQDQPNKHLHSQTTLKPTKICMNSLFHEALMVASEEAVTTLQLPWERVLRDVREDLSGQRTSVRKQSLTSILQTFRPYEDFDTWAHHWRFNSFMKTYDNTGIINITLPAFSTTHTDMLKFYEEYNTSLTPLPVGGRPKHADRPIRKTTSDFLLTLKKSIAIGAVPERVSETSPILRTFIEYIDFLIDETNFTMPIMIGEKENAAIHLRDFKKKKELMGDHDYPNDFNCERTVELELTKSADSAPFQEIADGLNKSAAAFLSGYADIENKDLWVLDQKVLNPNCPQVPYTGYPHQLDRLIHIRGGPDRLGVCPRYH